MQLLELLGKLFLLQLHLLLKQQLLLQHESRMPLLQVLQLQIHGGLIRGC